MESKTHSYLSVQGAFLELTPFILAWGASRILNTIVLLKMDSLTLVILTNSHKNLGYCVAGKEVFKRKDWQGVEGDWEADGWIRLVTSDQKSKGAVFYPQLRYADGKYVELLDIVKVPILCPHSFEDVQSYYSYLSSIHRNVTLIFSLHLLNSHLVLRNMDASHYYNPSQDLKGPITHHPH